MLQFQKRDTTKLLESIIIIIQAASYLVAVEVLDMCCETRQRVDESDGQVGVQVVATSLKQRMSDSTHAQQSVQYRSQLHCSPVQQLRGDELYFQDTFSKFIKKILSDYFLHPCCELGANSQMTLDADIFNQPSQHKQS